MEVLLIWYIDNGTKANEIKWQNYIGSISPWFPNLYFHHFSKLLHFWKGLGTGFVCSTIWGPEALPHYCQLWQVGCTIHRIETELLSSQKAIHIQMLYLAGTTRVTLSKVWTHCEDLVSRTRNSSRQILESSGCQENRVYIDIMQLWH